MYYMEKTQTKGLQRNTIDKYYTKEEIVKNCINSLKKNIPFLENDIIIEPSAGNGAFISNIKMLSKNYKFYDLEPEHIEIEKQDYLQLNLNELLEQYSNIHILGNPPFGRQSSLAIKFIKKSCEFCNTISFILPKSFKKESMQNHFPLKYHLLFEEDLPEKSFLVNNEEYTVPCIFQIWIKKENNREIKIKQEPKGFIFVEKNENPDISVRRVGVNAGKIDTNIAEKSVQSHYFIQFIHSPTNIPLATEATTPVTGNRRFPLLEPKVLQGTNGLQEPTVSCKREGAYGGTYGSPYFEENINKLKNIKFQHNNTAGPRSISKPELIYEFNKYLS